MLDESRHQVETIKVTWKQVVSQDLFAVGYQSAVAGQSFDYEIWQRTDPDDRKQQEWAYERGRQLAVYVLDSDGRAPRLFLDDDRINPRIEVLAMRMAHEGRFL